jgi:hypothetical protein
MQNIPDLLGARVEIKQIKIIGLAFCPPSDSHKDQRLSLLNPLPATNLFFPELRSLGRVTANEQRRARVHLRVKFHQERFFLNIASFVEMDRYTGFPEKP